MSFWLMVWLAEQLIVAFGASDEPLASMREVPSVAFASVMVTAARVVFPMFFATTV